MSANHPPGCESSLRHGCYTYRVMHCIKEQATSCMAETEKPVRQMTYKTRRMFFIRCVSDMYSDQARGFEVESIYREYMEEKS